MVLGVIACVLAVSSLLLSLWNYIDSRGALKKDLLPTTLKNTAEELSKDFDRKLRLIETEWEQMYDKFYRIAGRMDRQKGIEKAQAEEVHPPAPLTQSEVLRRWRNR